MSLCLYHAPQNEYLEGEHDTPMLESCLTFLATLINVRTNLGKFLLPHSSDFCFSLVLGILRQMFDSDGMNN